MGHLKHLWSILGLLGGVLAAREGVCVKFGKLGRHLGLILGLLGAFLAHLGSNLGGLGAILEASWAILEAS